MLIPSDYKELLKILNKHRVRYLIVGAYAVIYFTEPRYTKDIDIWIGSESKNAQRVYNALKEFGAPLVGITPKDFTKKDLVYQIGVAPVRVDIIMGAGGVDFNKAWKNKEAAVFEGVKVNIIGRKELIESKKKANRDSDRIDLKRMARKGG